MFYSIPNRSLASIVGLGILAIGSSVLLMPRGREMALLHLRTGDHQLGLSMLEARLASGDRAPATIAALARARAEGGDIDGAARLLEDMVERGQGSQPALTMLEGFERAAGRTAQLIRTLQHLQLVAPTMQRQREICELYAASGLPAERLRAVRDLVRLFPAEPVEYVTLAQLEAAAGNLREAEAALQSLAARSPHAVDASILGLEITILLSGDQAGRALARSRDWLEGRADLAVSAPILAGAFSMNGRPDLAVTLLEPLAARTAPTELVATLAQAESDSGRPDTALRRLERLDADGATRPGKAAALLRLRLALGAQDIDRARSAAERSGTAGLPIDLLLQLSDLALGRNRDDVLRGVLAAAGRDYLQNDPVLAARIELALGDREAAARWTALAAGAVADRPDRALQLAAVELKLGQAETALALLGRAVADARLQPAWLRMAAGLYIEARRADQGRAALETLRHARPGPAADLAWALAATASGHGQDVMAWLVADPRPAMPADALQDLFYLASDGRAYALALEAAGQLVVARGNPGDTLLLVRALLAAGQPKPALDRLRAIRDPAAVPEDLRAAVLLGAWRQKAPVGGELRAIWTSRLAAARTPQDRDAAISLLVELRAYAELMPVLARLAAEDPERWLWTFGEAANATGRKAELAAMWATLSARPGIPVVLRRQLAFRLLETGNKPAAERTFRALAATAPAGSPDVRELLFLWGPRPAPEQLAWIEARARQASGAEKAAWMRVLLNGGAPGRAVAIYRAATDERSPAAHEAYLAALAGIGDRTALAAAIRDELGRTASAAQLQRLAPLVERTGDTMLERQVLEKLVAAGGSNLAVQRRLGVLAYLRRDMGAAEQQLLAYTSAAGGDFEIRMILGDLALRRRDPASARHQYAASLALLQSSRDQSTRARTVMANLLHRLGRDDEAIQLYESLLAANPNDRNLRADYVAMLMEQGAHQRARLVLSSR